MLDVQDMQDDVQENAEDVLPEFAEIRNCPNCGTVSTYTMTCPYCGERLDD